MNKSEEGKGEWCSVQVTLVVAGQRLSGAIKKKMAQREFRVPDVKRLVSDLRIKRQLKRWRVIIIIIWTWLAPELSGESANAPWRNLPTTTAQMMSIFLSDLCTFLFPSLGLCAVTCRAADCMQMAENELQSSRHSSTLSSNTSLFLSFLCK